MKSYSKVFVEELVSKAKKVDKSERDSNGSLEIKVSDNDIKNIVGRKRLRQGLKANLIKDLEGTNFKASECDTNSLCIIIPKEKLDKKIINYSDI